MKGIYTTKRKGGTAVCIGYTPQGADEGTLRMTLKPRLESRTT